MALMLVTGIPVELPLLFEDGYKYFYNTPSATAARAAVEKGKRRIGKNKNKQQLSGPLGNSKIYNDYRNYLDQLKAMNEKYNSLNTYLMRGIADRIERYYLKYRDIPRQIMDIWKNPNMPYIILSQKKVVNDRQIIKLHASEITREKLDFELLKGNSIRITDLPKDFSLAGYEVYGDDTIENDAILGHYDLLLKALKTDIFSNIFAKRDMSEYAGAKGELDWLAKLEQMVDGDTLTTMVVRKSMPITVSTSIWYNIEAVISSKHLKTRKVYKGMLLVPKPIISVPLTLPSGSAFDFIHNFITSENIMIDLPSSPDTVITIVSRTLASAGISGIVSYGVTTITLDPGKLYYLVGRKGSGKSTKLALLSSLANVEDSDDYGVFLTEYLTKTNMMDEPLATIMDWIPSDSSFSNAVVDFMSVEHNYDTEISFFLLLSAAVIKSEIAPVKQQRRLVTLINRVMAHPYIGIQRYAAIRAKSHDPSKPTFVMCHSTAETGFRITPDDTIALSEAVDAQRVVLNRKRSGPGGTEAEMLLFYSYAQGISSINKLLPFAIILERLRQVQSDVSYGALQLGTGDITSS